MQNGQEVFAGRPRAELRLGAQPGAGVHKEHGMSGPLVDIFFEPFLIVYGTQGEDKQETEAARSEAEAIRTESVRGLRYHGLPIKSDRDVTPEDIEQFHLLLV